MFLFFFFVFFLTLYRSIKKPIGKACKINEENRTYRNSLIIVEQAREDYLQTDIKTFFLRGILRGIYAFTLVLLPQTSSRKNNTIIENLMKIHGNKNEAIIYAPPGSTTENIYRDISSDRVIGPAITMEKLHRAWRWGQRGRESGSPSRRSAAFQLKPPRPSCRHDRS